MPEPVHCFNPGNIIKTADDNQVFIIFKYDCHKSEYCCMCVRPDGTTRYAIVPTVIVNKYSILSNTDFQKLPPVQWAVVRAIHDTFINLHSLT